MFLYFTPHTLQAGYDIVPYTTLFQFIIFFNWGVPATLQCVQAWYFVSHRNSWYYFSLTHSIFHFFFHFIFVGISNYLLNSIFISYVVLLSFRHLLLFSCPRIILFLSSINWHMWLTHFDLFYHDSGFSILYLGYHVNCSLYKIHT